MASGLALKVGVFEIQLRLNQIRVLPQCMIVKIANALIRLVAVRARVGLFAGVHQVVGVEMAPCEEGLVALITFVGSLGHVRIVGAQMGAQVRLGWPRLAAHIAIEDARLGLACVHPGVRDQLGAQHEPSVAQFAGKGSLCGVQRCKMIAQTVARRETFRAHLALIAQPIAQPMHRYHMQLQLKVTRKLLFALGARTQRLWRPATSAFSTATCCCHLAWRPLSLWRNNWLWHTSRSIVRFLFLPFMLHFFGGLHWLQVTWQMDRRVQRSSVPVGACLLLIAPKQIRQIQAA